MTTADSSLHYSISSRQNQHMTAGNTTKYVIRKSQAHSRYSQLIALETSSFSCERNCSQRRMRHWISAPTAYLLVAVRKVDDPKHVRALLPRFHARSNSPIARVLACYGC